MMEQVFHQPPIYRLRGEEPGHAPRNGYLIAAGGELLAVDPPIRHPGGCALLEEARRELGGTGRLRVFFTHLHSGWNGLGPEWRSAGWEMLLHPADLRPTRPWAYQNQVYLREGYPRALLNQWKGWPEPPGGGEPAELVLLEDGQELTMGPLTLRFLHTPGHTPGHTCLYLPQEQVLFSGDLVLFEAIPYVGIWKGEPHVVEEFLDSLDRVRRLPVTQLLPAHGAGEGAFGPRAEAITNHYYFRLLELYRLICDHPGSTAYELATRFTRCRTPWEDVSPKRRWFAMGETLSHLAYLRARSYVQPKRGEEGRVYLPGRRRLTDG